MAIQILKKTNVGADGIGPVVRLGSDEGTLLVLTLVINQIVEREGVLVSMWGSHDGRDWGTMPIASFTPKYYCGVYSILLNLASRAEVRYLRVHWHIRRYRRGVEYQPTCEIEVSAEASGSRLHAVA